MRQLGVCARRRSIGTGSSRRDRWPAIEVRASKSRRVLDRCGTRFDFLVGDRQDALSSTVLEQLEVVRGQPSHNRTGFVAYDDVDEDEIQTTAKNGRRRLTRRLL